MGHVSKLGSQAYLFEVYPPLSLAEISEAEEHARCKMPAPLRAFYRCANGAWLYRHISVFGFVRAVTRDPLAPQPIDLQIENLLRPEGAFIFGGMTAWSAKAKLGMWPNGEVRLINAASLTEIPKTWPSFDHFIFEELDRLNQLHAPSGEFVGTFAELLPPEAAHLEKQRPDERDEPW